ncbi:DUF3613 domain-containing protein [Variovorax sp. Varisp41]|uniref:DUF3613 domain-containing protein n=1 Tax=unclassified Variovorax TaxID=663243 RepID=UPI0039B56A56
MINESVGRFAALSTRAAVAAFAFAGTCVCAQQVSATATPEPASVKVTPVVAPAPAAGAQSPAPVEAANSPDPLEEPVAMEEDEFDVPPLQVGDATLNLLAWQRSGEIASAVPRPISGSVANRSYERYLKSFDYPIPERLGSTVGRSGSSGSGSTAR